MWIWVVLLLAGCDRVFALDPVGSTDARGALTDSARGSSDAAVDASIADAARGAVLVQQATNENNANGLDVTLAVSPTSGDTLVLIGGAECGLTVVAGGGVASWQQAAYSGVSPTISIYYGITDGSFATVHVVPQCTSKTWGLVTEWSGLATDALDTQNAHGMSGAPSGLLQMAVDPTSAPDLLIFGITCFGTIGAPSTSWTELHQIVASSTITQRTWFQTVPTAGPYTFDVTYSNDYDAAVAAFRTAP